MKDKAIPIPQRLWASIQGFLKAGKTGQLVLDVHGGKVQSLGINERIRDDPREIETPAVEVDRLDPPRLTTR